MKSEEKFKLLIEIFSDQTAKNFLYAHMNEIISMLNNKQFDQLKYFLSRIVDIQNINAYLGIIAIKFSSNKLTLFNHEIEFQILGDIIDIIRKSIEKYMEDERYPEFRVLVDSIKQKIYNDLTKQLLHKELIPSNFESNFKVKENLPELIEKYKKNLSTQNHLIGLENNYKIDVANCIIEICSKKPELKASHVLTDIIKQTNSFKLENPLVFDANISLGYATFRTNSPFYNQEKLPDNAVRKLIRGLNSNIDKVFKKLFLNSEKNITY
ncbi:MAG: hypothetical protein J0H68_00930 [Sphingobacteriia bacterium]|nr:hypothetical protein [Sphingobacteriia bacterium]